jgi:hypothetical protein
MKNDYEKEFCTNKPSEKVIVEKKKNEEKKHQRTLIRHRVNRDFCR